MENLIKRAGVSGLVAAALGMGTGLGAQQRDVRADAAQQTDMGYPSPPEHKLNAFASAYIKVAEIYSAHAAQVGAARTSEQSYQARSTIDHRMSQAIQEEGLSPEEYIALVRSINEDPRLGRKVADKIRRLQ